MNTNRPVNLSTYGSGTQSRCFDICVRTFEGTFVPSEGTKVQYTYVYSTTYESTSVLPRSSTKVLSTKVLLPEVIRCTRTVHVQYVRCTKVLSYFRKYGSTFVRKYFRTFEGNLACRATVQRCRAYFRKYFLTLQYFRTFEEKIKVHVYVY